MDIGVIGSGIAGITASHYLQNDHNVTLIEKSQSIGGHSKTITIDKGYDAGTKIDVGFIVYNDTNYPTLTDFFNMLSVKPKRTDMSFSFSDEKGTQYAGTGPLGIFCKPINIINIQHYIFIKNIIHHSKLLSNAINMNEIAENKTIKDFLLDNNCPLNVINRYFIPMASAIWSNSNNDSCDMPAVFFARFFENHGLLFPKQKPNWFSVDNGSEQYLKKFAFDFKGELIKGDGVETIHRNPQKVYLNTLSGKSFEFDKIVIATHADQVLPLLDKPEKEEIEIFDKWHYSVNKVILHSDSKFLPKSKFARASWNFYERRINEKSNSASISYYMNRLQRLKTKNDYIVTLNPISNPKNGSIIFSTEFFHPTFNIQSINTQPKLSNLQGKSNTYYCGSYHGYGFHEDAANSALQVSNLIKQVK